MSCCPTLGLDIGVYMKVTDYEIVTGLNIGELQKKVLGYLTQGWQPLGGPFVMKLTQTGTPTKSVCQAMVKRDAD